MLIINKKRILFISIMIIVSIVSLNINCKTENIIETVALPVQDKIIILDAGHGLPDSRSF